MPHTLIVGLSALLLLTSGCVTPPHAGQPGTAAPATTSDIEYRDITTREIELPIGNLVVVSSVERWASLWRLYARELYVDLDRLPPHTPRLPRLPPAPAIDFEHNQLVLVHLGWSSGCGPAQPNIRRVERRAHHRAVIVHRPRFGELGPCQMVIPLDQFIAVARETSPIVFLDDSTGERLQLASPDAWWPKASMANVFDTTRTEHAAMLRHVARRTVLTDPAVPETDLVTAGELSVTTSDWEAIRWLLSNPRVQRSPTVLATIAVHDSLDHTPTIARDARRLLFTNFGKALAEDPRTPPPWLQQLANELSRREGGEFPPDTLARQVAERLVKNSTVLNNRALLRWLTRAVQREKDLHEQACRAYLARWDLEEVLARDTLGRAIMWVQAACWDYASTGRQGQ